MPPFKIPSAQPRVSRAPLPGVRQTVRTSPADFGAIEGGVISAVGEQIVDVAEAFERQDVREQKITIARQKASAELQERKDKMNAQASVLEFQEAWRGDKVNFLGPLRLNADGTTKKATEWFKKTQDSLLSKAKTERERQLITSSLGTEQTKILDKVSDHEFKQLNLAEVELSDSVYTNAIREAGAPDSNNTDRKDAELKAIDALNFKYKDFDKETRLKGVADGMSAFHEAIINGKIIGDLEFAKQYFNDTKQAILPKQREVIRKAIRKETVSQTARSIANDISLKEDDRTKWSAQVDKMTKDEEIRKEAQSILDAKKKDRDAHDNELKQREYTDGLTAVLKADNLDAGLEEAKKIDDPENQVKAIRVANSLYARKARDIETNIPVYANVLDRINAGEFRSVSELTEFYPDLSTSHYNHAISVLQSKLNDDKGDDIKYKTAIDAYTFAVGEAYDVEDEDQNREFTFAYDKLVDMGITDFDTATKTIRNLVIEGEVRGALWDSTLTRQEAEAEGKLNKWLPNLLEVEDDNGVERRKVDDLLRSRGIVTKNETLKRLFKKDAILKLPLSKNEVAEYRRLLNLAGKTRPIGETR
jgi:hypothetical protein